MFHFPCVVVVVVLLLRLVRSSSMRAFSFGVGLLDSAVFSIYILSVDMIVIE